MDSAVAITRWVRAGRRARRHGSAHGGLRLLWRLRGLRCRRSCGTRRVRPGRAVRPRRGRGAIVGRHIGAALRGVSPHVNCPRSAATTTSLRHSSC
jgi:hypothetical protein